MVDLRRLLAESTPGRKARVRQELPDIAALLTPVAVADLVTTEGAAAAAAREAATERSAALSTLTHDDLATLRQLVGKVAERLHRLDLDGSPATWPATWVTQALADGFAGREMAGWRNLGGVAGQAEQARDQLTSLGLRRVSLPDFDETGSDSIVGQLDAGRALRVHLAAGHTIKRRMRPQVQKRAARLLDGALVDGIPVTSIELLDLVLARLDAEHTAEALGDRWADVQVYVDRSTSLEMRVPKLVDLASDLGDVLTVVDLLDQARALLAVRGVLVPLRTPHDWVDVTVSLAAVEARLQAEQATQTIAAHVSRIELAASSATAPPELSDMARALAARDVARYDHAIRQLAGVSAEQEDQRRCDALWARLHDTHPVLADQLAQTAGDEYWDTTLSTWADAWAWGKAWTFFDALRQPGREETLAAQLDEAIDQVGRATGALAAEEAWGRCLERMTAHQEQALRAYKANMADRGGGYGRWAHRYAAAAREAMVEARGAVPAWIMPLREVVETIPPDANSFDVVIVDEASQARIEALFLLWLAPRVIVVGDERQCAPSQVAHGRLQPIFDRLDDYLHDLPEYLRLGFTPKSNLFGVLSTRFGSVIRLREHFRCMPEIIGWSSGTFYRDEPLVPLRQYGADRLPPIRIVHVANATAEGSSSRIRNRAEAEAIVAQVKDCIADPAYADKTFGVVVLQGRAQIGLIDDLIQAEIPHAERERRHLRVGSPPDFQGDERHVVFMSMVIADRHAAVTHREWQRRFNVAASRAQDQMWLFHSVTVDLLQPRDLRRSLLTYALNPPTDIEGRVFDDLDWTSQRREPFDSVFEQRVYIALRDRGYRVTPQYEVNGRRIDLVVTGDKGRLAVECDGDYWHSGHEAQLADIDRQLELQRAGWRFWRVRESEFYLDPDAALVPLWAELEKRGIRPGDFRPSNPVPDPEDVPAPRWAPIELSDEEPVDDVDDLAAVDDWQSFSTRRPRSDRAVSRACGPVAGQGSSQPPAREVRAWAESMGLRVGQRGRLHPDVVNAWNQAHPGRPYGG